MASLKTNVRIDKRRSHNYKRTSVRFQRILERFPVSVISSSTRATTSAAQLHTPRRRLVLIGAGLAAIVSIILLAFLWPTQTSSVHNLPVAIAGDSAQTGVVADQLADKSPDAFDITQTTTRADAVALVKSRTVYGAIVLGAKPEVLTASAASPVVSQLLSGFVPLLQNQITAAATAQGAPAASIPRVLLTDLVPLADTDARGAEIASAGFPLVLGGMLGGIVITIAVVGVWRRVGALLIYAIIGGLAISAILGPWFGALQGGFLADAAAIALAILGIGGTIVGFVSVVGRAGIAIGPVLFLLVANPIASSAQPMEFLPGPWGAIGQWFPPGAASTLLRELSYFPSANLAFPWLVLAGWAALGLLLSMVGHFRQRGAAAKFALDEAVAG
jgi:hypothetical protein